jgi:hypothetical protein
VKVLAIAENSAARAVYQSTELQGVSSSKGPPPQREPSVNTRRMRRSEVRPEEAKFE